jgi:hypothetical protein
VIVHDLYVESEVVVNQILVGDFFAVMAVDDDMSLSCDPSSLAVLSAIVADRVDFREAFIDEVTECDTIALNTQFLHASVYSGFAYNSFTVFDGVVYAACDDGVFILDSDKDNGVPFSSGVLLPSTYLGSLSKKRIRMCFIDSVGEQPLVRVKASSSYTDEMVSTQKISRSRAYFPRTILGKEFEVAIADFDSLARIEFFVTILTR